MTCIFNEEAKLNVLLESDSEIWRFNRALLLLMFWLVHKNFRSERDASTSCLEYHVLSRRTANCQEMLRVYHHITLDVLPCLQACSESNASQGHGGSCCCESSPEESRWSLQPCHSSSNRKYSVYCGGLNPPWQLQLLKKKNNFIVFYCFSSALCTL